MGDKLVLENLGKASRRYAFVSLGGFLIVILAFVYSFQQLRSLEAIKEQKVSEIADLDQKKIEVEAQLKELESRLATANQKAQILNSLVDQVSLANSGAQAAIQQTIESNPAAADVVPRVYLEIRDERQRGLAMQVAKVLEDHQYLTPPFEVVGKKMPDKAQIRYYREAESTEVNAIVQILMAINFQVEPRLMSGMSVEAKPRHYELWLGVNQ